MILTLDTVRKNIVGRYFSFETPYGTRLMTYVDYTASGRPLRFIETYLLRLQQSYANTHTEDDVTGRNMTFLLHKATDMIRQELNAGSDCVIIPAGTGATGAIEKLMHILGIYCPPATIQRLFKLCDDEDSRTLAQQLIAQIKQKCPVVFIGPYEHHSNDLPWRESLCEVVTIKLTEDDRIDLNDLHVKLSDPAYQNRLKIGSFSATSNVTGTLTPVYEVARILHNHNALACFDFAASAPYVEINMNRDEESYFDAVFFSPHKFLGGPGSCGILVLRQEHYPSSCSPTFAGGGTVDYVSSFAYDFSADVETRESPGTPGVFQIFRAALCLEVKSLIGLDVIHTQEQAFIDQAMERFQNNSSMEVLGTRDCQRKLAIFSLLFKHKDRYLHPKLVTCLLNDLFGIQSRAGCSCAGPYGHSLLKIDNSLSARYRSAIQAGYSSIKPGWVRVNFHYTLLESDFEFICQALEFVAEYGHLFIPEYVMDLETGMWLHRQNIENLHIPEFGLRDTLPAYPEMGAETINLHREDEYKKYLQFAREKAQELQGIIPEYTSLWPEEFDELSFFYCQHFRERQ
ncbi:aminotransferase class V-fold PLP-dependent enzyme [candidate division CSSED10-310 bacterium]|uniref:Aminotransferase class V-fold PLP-dependent enzyme n=1 Tax=candidate division CSSED10-310 bacterium TaxID=2855610 RepID=A0ABV6YY97_UNCC1